METDSPIPQLTKDVGWTAPPPGRPSPPRTPIVWTRRDIAGGLAGLATLVVAMVVVWPWLVTAYAWSPGLQGLVVTAVGMAHGILGAAVSAAVAGRPTLDPFGRAKPGLVRRLTFLHVLFFAATATVAFVSAQVVSGWLWAYGAFWVGMCIWRIRVGLTADRATPLSH